MPSKSFKHALPKYHGKRWIDVGLPKEGRDWARGGDVSIGDEDGDSARLTKELSRLTKANAWVWPKRPLYFFTDPHADAEALAASLVACGGVKKTGPGHLDFKLTESGRRATFIIGGDCFEKGPSNLDLLQLIRRLIDLGARTRILAGNHDVRVMFGMRTVGQTADHRSGHFFVRLGPKVVPFLREVWDRYLEGTDALRDVPGIRECRRRLYPRKDWFDAFPKVATSHLTDKEIAREMVRIRKKIRRFPAACKEAGLSLRQVYAVALKWRELFLEPDGEFHWYFKRMRLSYQSGSFLFIHAGFDDPMARLLRDQGVKELNRLFKRAMKQDPFDFYYDSIGNTIRTKYRNVDKPLTQVGAKCIRRSGVHAIVHGHRNLLDGQRIMLRRGIINFECDITLDRGTRRSEGLTGLGAGVTIIHPDGRVVGISSDYPYAKVFEPAATLKALRAMPASGARTGKTP